jgi:hypothetical protein
MFSGATAGIAAMAGAKTVLAIAFLVGSASFAAEPAIHISCIHTSQAGFDGAVALMSRQPMDAHRIFWEMWRRDQDCAILLWGMAMSAADPEERQGDALYAIITAVIAGVDDDESRKIFALLRLKDLLPGGTDVEDQCAPPDRRR